MKKIKIAIIFGTKPNFDKYAFKYFILYVNKIQSVYEFCFLDVTNFPFEKGVVDFDSSHSRVARFVEENKLIADHYIAIITNSFNNNFFFNAEKRTSVITTDIWDKHFSPPSLFEYLLHCIFTCLIYSQNHSKEAELSDDQMLINIGSHRDTRGCIADFTRQKYDDRIDIILGYICEEHSEEIRCYYGQEYLEQIQYVIERKWIGDIQEKESVAYNLKHIFKFDINKDSGFNKNWWEKMQNKFYEIPGTLTGEIFKIIITALLTYFLIKWGLIDKKG